MNQKRWKDLSPEERKQIRKRQALAKETRTRREKQKEAKRQAKHEQDKTSAALVPGMLMRCRESTGLTRLIGKVCLFLAWEDDGHNHRRSARNKQITVAVEPHRYDTPETMSAKLGWFTPVNEMEVIAEAFAHGSQRSSSIVCETGRSDA